MIKVCWSCWMLCKALSIIMYICCVVGCWWHGYCSKIKSVDDVWCFITCSLLHSAACTWIHILVPCLASLLHSYFFRFFAHTINEIEWNEEMKGKYRTGRKIWAPIALRVTLARKWYGCVHPRQRLQFMLVNFLPSPPTNATEILFDTKVCAN